MTALMWMDGAAGDDVVRVFVAGDPQVANTNITRLCLLREDGTWYYWDFEAVVVTVQVKSEVGSGRRTYLALGRDGKIFYMESGQDPVEEAIRDAGTGPKRYGYLSEARYIGVSFFACGDRGQVYGRNSRGRWTHVDQGLLQDVNEFDSKLGLNSLDGAREDDLYVAGDNGRIFHFDGRAWADVSPATNLHIERIRRVGDDRYIACGKNGLVLEGNRAGWRFLVDPDADQGTLWDVASFGGRLYFAAEDRLAWLNVDRLDLIDTGLAPTPDAYRLDVGPDRLWSFGERHICCFDGIRWTFVAHPDNTP